MDGQEVAATFITRLCPYDVCTLYNHVDVNIIESCILHGDMFPAHLLVFVSEEFYIAPAEGDPCCITESSCSTAPVVRNINMLGIPHLPVQCHEIGS